MRLLLLLLSALLVACPTVMTVDDDDSAAEPTPEPAEQYLGGTSVFTLPNGQETPPARVLIHRTLDPSEGSLVEDVYQQSDPTTWDHYVIEGTIDPDTGEYTFSFFDGYGTFEGTGTMTAGETWAWTAWNSRSVYVDGPYVGSYVLSQDTLDEAGLEANKQVFSPDDHAEGSVYELLEWTEAEAWQAEVDGIEL